MGKARSPELSERFRANPGLNPRVSFWTQGTGSLKRVEIILRITQGRGTR